MSTRVDREYLKAILENTENPGLGQPHEEGEFSLPLYITPAHVERVAAGKFYLSGTGKMTLNAAGHVRVTMANPSLTKPLYLAKVVWYTTIESWVDLYINPTTGLPSGSARPHMNALVGGGVAGVGELRGDTSADTPLGGGTYTGIDIGLEKGRTSVDLAPLVILPGQTLGIGVEGVVDAAVLSTTAYWFE